MAANQRKTIGLIFAGGTTYLDSRGQRQTVRRESDSSRWLAGLPELNIIADVEPVFVFGDGTGAVTSTRWRDIANAIAKIFARVDGVVVLLSNESFIYSAAALSLALTNLAKPIVITGTPLVTAGKTKLSPYHTLGARANLLNAAHVALADIAEVVVAYGSGVFRAATLVRSESTAEMFGSAERPLGRIDFGVSIQAAVVPRAHRKLTVRADFNPDVHVIEYHPTSLKSLTSHHRSVAGLLVAIGDVQQLTAVFRTELLKRKRAGAVPVIFTPGARSSDDRQLIIVNDLTLEMTLVKLMWALAKTKNYEQIRKILRQPVAGERLKKTRR